MPDGSERVHLSGVPLRKLFGHMHIEISHFRT